MRRVLAASMLLLLASSGANAAVRAWLDRDHVALGENITLTIESDGSPGKPDLTSLRKDFEVHGIATGSQTSIVNGSMRSTMQWSVTLQPRHAGLIDIPAFLVGSEKTPALRVGVDNPAATAATPPGAADASHDGPANSAVIVESSLAPERPYVGQAAIYTLRLSSAVALLDASLDVPTTNDGDLRQIGDDERDSVMLQGHRYDVIQRHYLILPEHSGTLRIPAPVFQGRTMPNLGGAFDDDLSSGGLRTTGKAIEVQVRPKPPQAADPWLPARSMRLTIEPVAATPHAGEPFSLLIREDGEGVTAAQLPEISLPAIDGAQVYPEPSSTVDHAHGGVLQAERSRRFAIVPDHEGDLRLPALSIPWWNVANDRAEVARLELPTLHVTPGTAMQGRSGAIHATGTPSSAPILGGDANELRRWQIASAILAALLVCSLWWGWRRGRGLAPDGDDGEAVDVSNEAPALATALERGVPAAIVQALLDAAARGTPHEDRPRHLAEVARRLDDPSQHDAVLAFDASRWRAGGDPLQAVARLREAFARPPRWRISARLEPGIGALPPLYPS